MRIKNYLKLGIVCLFVVVLLMAAQGIAFSASRYTITVSYGAGGKITPAGPSVRVYSGDSQNFTIQANSGYRIADVLVDGGSMGPVSSYRFRRVNANHTIAASFVALASYTITASAGTGGSISPSGTITVTAGSSKAFSITVNTGYQIGDVKVDGTSKGALSSYTFTNITANHSIAVSFTAIPVYTINASAGTGGSINPSGTINVNQGSSKTFSITANSGYQISAVTVDGTSMGALSSYTFSNLKDNHSIAASFATLPAGQGGFVSITMDDSWLSQYTAALPILNKYGIKATFYSVTIYVSDEYEDFMSLDQLKALKAGGHEIGSHTVTHPDLTTLGATQLNAELTNSKSWLEANGLGPVTDFACPYGEYNNTTITATKKYYLSQRSGYDEGYNTRANFDPYRLKVQIMTSSTTMAEFSGWLAEAKAEGAWLILEYHQVDNSGDEYGVTPANFDRQMQGIQASGLTPLTVNQALNQFGAGA